MSYPVSVSVAPALASRNRLTTAFRLVLAIPHVILVGGVGLGIASREGSTTTVGGEGGLLGAVAVFLAIVSWFTIVIGGASIEIVPAGPRDRLSVGLRILLVIPHFIVLLFVLLAWCFTTIAAWFIILFTGVYPQGLYEFGVGALRWLLRVQAYMLLLVDEYPPFSLA